MIRSIQLASLGLVVLGVLILILLIARRALLGRRERRTLEAEGRLRPIAISLVEGEPVDLSEVSRRDEPILAALLARYSGVVSGGARGHISSFFESRGLEKVHLTDLRRRRAWRRAAAAYILGEGGSERAVEGLMAALGDRAPEVRSAAARSLGRLGAVDAIGPILGATVTGKIPASVGQSSLLAIGPAALPSLRDILRNQDPQVRSAALRLIGFVGGAADAERIHLYLKDRSASVRAAAADALRRLGDEGSTEPLLTALEDPDERVRAAAARALGAVGDDSVADALLRHAKTDEFDVARASAESLAEIDQSLVLRLAREEDAGDHLKERADLIAIRGGHGA